MKQVIAKAAAACGIQPPQAEEAVRAIFQWLAGEVEAASWGKLVAALPEVGRLGGPHRPKGLLASLTGGAAGYLPLLAKLAKAGVSTDKLRALVTPVVGHLKASLEPRLFAELEGQLPAALRAKKK